jgi:hypothetical protein
MYQNSFGVSVEGGRERESGYVEMRHGSTYKLRLRNDRSVPCDATLEIDGKDMGSFRIGPHGKILIERPANESKKFTFFKSDTREARQSGQAGVAFDAKGLIKVTFRPGVESQPVAIVTEDSRGWEGQLGSFDVPTNLSRSASHSFRDIDPPTEMREALRDIFEGPQASMSDDDEPSWEATASRSRGDVTLSMKVEGLTASRAAIRRESPKKGRRSGVTGLTGSSNQRFSSTSALSEYDLEHETEINLRLVAVEDEREDPTPLRPVTRQTPIPPPIYLF